MAATRIMDGLHAISADGANLYLIDAPEGLTLIDTGFAKSEAKIIATIRGLGHSEADLRHIVLTHAHQDHIGCLGALQRASGARIYIHALDAPIAEAGRGFRPLKSSPELLGAFLFRIFSSRPDTNVPPARIDALVADSDTLPLAGGLTAIHVPGHCAGQLAYLWRERGVLFAGDAAMNLMGLGFPIGFEDVEEGRRSLRKLAALDFDVACFGHGRAITRGAAARFRTKWG